MSDNDGEKMRWLVSRLSRDPIKISNEGKERVRKACWQKAWGEMSPTGRVMLYVINERNALTGGFKGNTALAFVSIKDGSDLVLAVRILDNNGASAQMEFWSDNKPGTRHELYMGQDLAVQVERIDVYSEVDANLIKGWRLAEGFTWE